MKKHLLLSMLASAALISPSGAQTFGNAELNVNNVRAQFNAAGDLFWDFTDAEFEVPAGSGKNTLYAGNLWIGAVDAGGQLYVAAQTYRQTGTDFFQGPVSGTSSYSAAQDQAWNKVWTINKSSIDSFRLWFQNNSLYPGYTIPQSLLSWPAHGNPSLGEASNLAPFFDQDNNGTYNPANGDFPCIKGDQAIYFIFNDHRDTHTESGGLAMGLELHAMAYAFKNSPDTALNNTIFLKYQVINRSSNDYQDAYIGNWSDLDLGYGIDDYIGSDVGRSAYYGYNGDNNDEGGGYGIAPPAQGVVFLRGPEADAGDGVDNDRNGTVDEFGEVWDMSKFVYYQNDNSVNGNPQTATEYYKYLQGTWKDGTPLTYGGNGYNPNGTPADFMFPGTTDPSGWGTGGNPQAAWDEFTSSNTPGDRRGLGVYGPFTFSAGESICLDFAYVYSRGSSNTASVTKMQNDIDHVQAVYDSSLRACECNVDFTGIADGHDMSVSIYPNPANGFINVDMQSQRDESSYVVMDMTGRQVLGGKLAPAAVNTLNIEELSTGIYVIRITNADKIYTKLISKQ